MGFLSKLESEKLDIAQGENIGDPLPLEDKEKLDKEQETQGLKRLTPQQMIAYFISSIKSKK